MISVFVKPFLHINTLIVILVNWLPQIVTIQKCKGETRLVRDKCGRSLAARARYITAYNKCRPYVEHSHEDAAMSD